MNYSKKVMEHFRNPRNYGRIENPDGLGKVGNPVCGDVMWLYIKVKGGKISNVKFETFGCAAAIATSSMITELAKGKTIARALALSRDNILKELGGLPPIKVHCSMLAIDALHAAIYDYLSKKKLPIPAELEQEHTKLEKERAGKK